MNQAILDKYKSHVWANHGNINTRRVYTDHPRVFLEYIAKPLYNINQQDVDNYLTEMHKDKYINGNVVRFWSVRKFLQWANLSEIQIPSITPVDAGKKALDENEAQKLLDTIPTLRPLHQLVFYLEYDAIRRPSEVRTIQISDRYRDMLTLDTKTGKKTVIMSQRLIEAWDNYIQHQRPIPLNESEAKYLILIEAPCWKGTHYRYNNGIDRIIKEILMYSNVEIPRGQQACNYLIKRTSITLQLKHCNDPKIIQHQAGHTKLSTTMKYNRLDDEHIRNYLEAFTDKRQVFKRKQEENPDKSFLSNPETTPTPHNKWTIVQDDDNNSVTISFSLFHNEWRGFDDIFFSFCTPGYLFYSPSIPLPSQDGNSSLTSSPYGSPSFFYGQGDYIFFDGFASYEKNSLSGINSSFGVGFPVTDTADLSSTFTVNEFQTSFYQSLWCEVDCSISLTGFLYFPSCSWNSLNTPYSSFTFTINNNDDRANADQSTPCQISPRSDTNWQDQHMYRT